MTPGTRLLGTFDHPWKTRLEVMQLASESGNRADESEALSATLEEPHEFRRRFHALILNVNKQSNAVDVPGEMPLLWVLHDVLGLKGTKDGRGIAQDRACTMHVDGRAVRSCITPVRTVENAKIMTTEGLGDTAIHSVQDAWDEVDVPQCGYCQPGQIMSAAALLSKMFKPPDADIEPAMTGDLHRCGTYPRI